MVGFFETAQTAFLVCHRTDPRGFLRAALVQKPLTVSESTGGIQKVVKRELLRGSAPRTRLAKTWLFTRGQAWELITSFSSEVLSMISLVTSAKKARQGGLFDEYPHQTRVASSPNLAI